MKVSLIILAVTSMCMGVLSFAGMAHETIHFQVRLSDDTQGGLRLRER